MSYYNTKSLLYLHLYLYIYGYYIYVYSNICEYYIRSTPLFYSILGIMLYIYPVYYLSRHYVTIFIDLHSQ